MRTMSLILIVKRYISSNLITLYVLWCEKVYNPRRVARKQYDIVSWLLWIEVRVLSKMSVSSTKQKGVLEHGKGRIAETLGENVLFWNLVGAAAEILEIWECVVWLALWNNTKHGLWQERWIHQAPIHFFRPNLRCSHKKLISLCRCVLYAGNLFRKD